MPTDEGQEVVKTITQSLWMDKSGQLIFGNALITSKRNVRHKHIITDSLGIIWRDDEEAKRDVDKLMYKTEEIANELAKINFRLKANSDNEDLQNKRNKKQQKLDNQFDKIRQYYLRFYRKNRKNKGKIEPEVLITILQGGNEELTDKMITKAEKTFTPPEQPEQKKTRILKDSILRKRERR